MKEENDYIGEVEADLKKGNPVDIPLFRRELRRTCARVSFGTRDGIAS